MAKRQEPFREPKRIPSVRIVRPGGRPFQLRYLCPEKGKEVRISTGCRDEVEALRQKRELEAKLLLGIQAAPTRRPIYEPNMEWDEFREQYRTIHLATLGIKSSADSESRLDIATKVMAPKTLGDLANSESLHRLQTLLLGGAESVNERERSPHTVRSYMASVLAAINWAHLQGWIETMPRFRRLKVGRLKAMKGRPLSGKEFLLMLDQVEAVVGAEATPSWKHLLRGLWESGLRLGELMHVSWDDPNKIMPQWSEGKRPVLNIPHTMQKNATEESIPLLPWFERLLLETPEADRKGWVFNPQALQAPEGGDTKDHRLTTEWVGRIVSRIGEKANIIVAPGDEARNRPTKYASAHDLRRSSGQRLLDAGVPPTIICRVMRHADWETTRRHYAPGDVQKEAATLQQLLALPV